MIVCRDEEMDGEWEAPQIPNPACETAPGCGRWKRPMINNPEYKGKWKAPLVDNPNYQVSHSQTSDPIRLKRLVIPFQKHSFCSEGSLEAKKDQQPGLFRGLASVSDEALQSPGPGALVHDLGYLL